MPALDADLGLAVLVAEAAEDAGYEPVAVVRTLEEAVEVSASDLRSRCARLEAGASPLCPEYYVVWARDNDGHYRRVHEMLATSLGGPAR